MGGEVNVFPEMGLAWGILNLLILAFWLTVLLVPVLGLYLFFRLVRAVEQMADRATADRAP